MRVKLGSLDVKARDSVQHKLTQGRNISRSVPQFHRAAPPTVTSNAHESSGRANALLEPNLKVIENRVTTCRDWGSAPAVGLNGLTFLMVPPRVEVSVFVVLSVFVFYFFSFFYLKRQFSMMSLPRSASIHAAGMASAPYTMPASAPATAAVVSVSSPRLTARRTHSS